MRLLCPVCCSDNIRIKTPTIPSNNQLPPTDVFPMVGASISKSLNVNPVLGALAGIAVATLVQMAKQEFEPVLPNLQFSCEHCHHNFNQPYQLALSTI